MRKLLTLCVAVIALSCSSRPALVSRKAFQGEVSGVPIDLYTLQNRDITVQVTNFGARVVSMYTRDRDGNYADIVVGHDNLEAYVKPAGERFLGATVGPVANRIRNASFKMEGETWHTDANENGVTTLHGGYRGLDMCPWTVESHTDTSITLSLLLPHGHDGFPGNRNLTITYSISHEDFKVVIEGTTNKRTILNIAHHPFFCLRGEGNGTVNDYLMTIHAQAYTPVDSLLIATGEIAPVEGTPFDFRSARPIGDFEYDNNWCLDGEGFRSVCLVKDPVTGRTVEVITDQPGLQVYSGNFFNGSENGKNGKPLTYRSSLVLEAQAWPDAINHPNFPSIEIAPSQTYRSNTIFRFGAE